MSESNTTLPDNSESDSSEPDKIKADKIKAGKIDPDEIELHPGMDPLTPAEMEAFL